MLTELYITKHRAIQSLLNEISVLIQNGIESSADKLSDSINRMTGVIKMHLASEDKHLYPLLLKSSDAKIRAITKNYMEEMGDLAKIYTDFAENYNTASKILSNKAGFETTFAKVKHALNYRINREEKELYLFIDKV